jgi:four helix bundle protein
LQDRDQEAEEAKEAEDVEEKQSRAGPIRRYHDLLVYQQAYRLTLEVSRLSKKFPRHEQFELGRQIRRSSRSVAANVVEGWAKRASAAEFRRHLQIAIGECEETRFWLDLAVDEECASKQQSENLRGEYAKLGMMIRNLWKEWRKL